MTYAFYYDTPGNSDWYAKVSAALGDELPEGLVVHLATEIDGGIRHYNVWDSQEQWLRYRQERVRPAVGAMLAAAGIAAPTGPPEEHEIRLLDLEARSTPAIKESASI